MKAELTAVQLDWSRPAGRPDMASALIRIFARMAAHVVDNLNQVPNLHFLTFLNLIGAQRQPPQPARAALTFSMAADAPVEAVVPAGTRVAAPPAEGEQEEVVFETETELVVSRSRLAAVVVHRPDLDLYADRSPEAPGGCLSSEVDVPIEHSLFIDGGDLLALPAGTLLALQIGLPPSSASTWDELPFDWAYADGGVWKPLSLDSSDVQTVGGERRQIVAFKLPAPLAPSIVDGREGRWLRATLTVRLTSAEVTKVPVVHDLMLDADCNAVGLPADAALSGTTPQDLSLDFLPFGERPRIGDAFYLASQEVFSLPNALVGVNFTRSPAALALVTGDDPTLIWEIWTKTGWMEVGRSNKTSGSLQPLPLTSPDTPCTPTEPSIHGFEDATRALSLEGIVSFTTPATVAPTTIGGITSHWLRVRIARGTQVYGRGATFVPDTVAVAGPDDTTVNVPINVLVDNGYRPPVIASISLSYTHQPSAPVGRILSLDDFVYADHTAENAAGFLPCVHQTADAPSIHFGFDPPFANRSVSLYVDIAPPLPLEVAASTLLGAAVVDAPVFTWEYSAPSGRWARLGAEDETNGFQRSGVVRFIGPPDLEKRRALGKDCYWLRARLVGGQLTASARLRCLQMNTVWAHQAVTITGELLGSSNGAADQVFTLTRTPVLPGQRIDVLEPATLSSAKEQGIDLSAVGVEPALDERGDVMGYWVPWSEVSDFHASGPGDRHYLLDRTTGEIRFGDGVRGLPPPVGQANVRAATYRAGGGSRGNRPAGTITELKTTVAYVQGVVNTVSSTGGSDLGSVSRLKELGPRILRHGQYAIAAEDYEDLACQASTAVARARAVTPTFDPVAQIAPPTSFPAGSVLVIVVPFGAEARPAPAPSLIEDVRSYLLARCPPAVSLRIAGPDWVRVTAEVTLAPVSITASDELVVKARTAIERWLHPLTGGPDQGGWEFGSLPQASDIYPILMGIPGVDHIRKLKLTYEQETDTGSWVLFPASTPADVMRRILVFSGAHEIDVYASGG
ncbi:MAG: putative baseplate assembly protein [Minicystis sp.]